MTEGQHSAGTWNWWLASPSYESAPKKLPKHQGQEATKAPIDSSFESAFIGKKVEDVANWLKNKADNIDLDDHHFAILDRGAKGEETVVVCRIGDKNLKGDNLDWIRFPASRASLHLAGMEFGEWEDFRGDGRPADIKY